MSNANFNPTLSTDEVWRGTNSSRCLTDDLDGMGSESTVHPGCYYRTVDGATEWINPPMLAGTEYRTTERWCGMPVYTQILPIGSWAKGGTVDYNISPHVIRYCGRIGSWTLPFINNSTDNAYSVWATFHNNSGKLRLGMCGGTGVDGSGGHIQIWYYKV